MKPRIWLSPYTRGRWLCTLIGVGSLAWGGGSSPSEAYANWHAEYQAEIMPTGTPSIKRSLCQLARRVSSGAYANWHAEYQAELMHL